MPHIIMQNGNQKRGGTRLDESIKAVGSWPTMYPAVKRVVAKVLYWSARGPRCSGELSYYSFPLTVNVSISHGVRQETCHSHPTASFMPELYCHSA